MGGIYQWLRTGASFILLAAVTHAEWCNASATPRTLLWTQPTGLAVGDQFMAVGYGRGVEFWDWPPDSVPRMKERLAGPAVTAMWGSDSTLYWCAADSTLRVAVLSGSTWNLSAPRRLDGPCGALAGSSEFVAAVIGTTHVQFARRYGATDTLVRWQPPASFPVAYLSVRDSTAAVVGADRAFLVRLRDSGALLLDSLPLGDFAQAVLWAGDSLFLAFGFGGVKLATTLLDRFDGGLSTWSSQGTFGRLALTESACTAVDFFGGIEIFARGQPLVPFTHSSFGGTLRAAAGRNHEVALLTVERGLLLLNLFTLNSPFWAYQAPFPGFVRDLDRGSASLFALADFSGVYELGPNEELVVNHPFNAQALDVEWPHLAAASLLAGVAVADLLSASLQPYAVVPTVGSGRSAVIAADRLFVAGDGACDTGVVVYQVSPPQAPVELHRMSVCGFITAMAAGPDVVAIALRDSGLFVYDAYAPEQGAMARWPAGEVFDELIWHESSLWGRNRASELVRWQWDGLGLAEGDRYFVPGLRTFDVLPPWVVTADSSRHARVWRWQPGSALQPVDSCATRNLPVSVAVLGDTVWVVDGDAILRFELDHGADVWESPVLPQDALLGVPYPNPFNGAVTLTLHLNRGRWSVRVVDLLGRSVSRWSGVAGTSGPHRLVWDPGQAGQAASGVYFIRAENAGVRQSRKVVYLK